MPALAAKDIIDIQITVATLDTHITEIMLNHGYIKPAGIYWSDHSPNLTGHPDNWKKFLFVERTGERRANIHVRVRGRANQRFALLFRDFLRAYSDYAQVYAELKRNLATNLADPSTYPEVKQPAVQLIQLAAEKWAKETGWRVGSGD